MLTIKALEMQRQLIQLEAVEARATPCIETITRIEDRAVRVISQMEQYLQKHGRDNVATLEAIQKLNLPEGVQNCLMSIRAEVQDCAAEMNAQLNQVIVQRDAALDRCKRLEGQVSRLTAAVNDENARAERLQKKTKKLKRKLRRSK